MYEMHRISRSRDSWTPWCADQTCHEIREARLSLLKFVLLGSFITVALLWIACAIRITLKRGDIVHLPATRCKALRQGRTGDRRRGSCAVGVLQPRWCLRESGDRWRPTARCRCLQRLGEALVGGLASRFEIADDCGRVETLSHELVGSALGEGETRLVAAWCGTLSSGGGSRAVDGRAARSVGKIAVMMMRGGRGLVADGACPGSD